MKTSAFFFLMLGLGIHGHAQIGAEFRTDSLSSNTFIALSFISDSEGWVADNAGGLWHTTTGGETWSYTFTEKNFLQLDFADALQGFGLTAQGVFKSSDGGNTWSALTLPGQALDAL